MQTRSTACSTAEPDSCRLTDVMSLSGTRGHDREGEGPLEEKGFDRWQTRDRQNGGLEASRFFRSRQPGVDAGSSSLSRSLDPAGCLMSDFQVTPHGCLHQLVSAYVSVLLLSMSCDSYNASCLMPPSHIPPNRDACRAFRSMCMKACGNPIALHKEHLLLLGKENASGFLWVGARQQHDVIMRAAHRSILSCICGLHVSGCRRRCEKPPCRCGSIEL